MGSIEEWKLYRGQYRIFKIYSTVTKIVNRVSAFIEQVKDRKMNSYSQGMINILTQNAIFLKNFDIYVAITFQSTFLLNRTTQ